MSTFKALEPVVQKVDSIPKTLSTSEKGVIYDRRRHEVLPKKPLLPGGQIEFYLVSTAQVLQYEGLSVVVEDFNSSRKIGLLVSYRASCESGNEEHLIAQLCRDVTPGLDLNRRIEQWIFSLTRDRADEFIDNFVKQIPWLKRELERQAEQVGLRLDVRLTLDKSPIEYLILNAKTTQNIVDRENLIILIQDVANSREIGVSITYQARLRDDKNRDKIIKALGTHDTVADAMDEKLREWVGEFLGNRATQFIDNYASEIASLQQRLENRSREELNLVLSSRIDLDRNPVEYVFSKRDTSNIARRDNLVIPVEDIAGNRRIALSITYQAGFDSQDRDKVARAFATSKSITNEIDQKLKTWVTQFIERITSERFIDRYTTHSIELQQNLQYRAKEEVGLKLELRVQLDKQYQLETFKIGSAQKPIQLPVFVKDCDDELQLRLHTELSVDEDNITNAVLRSLPSQEFTIVNLVKKKIKDYLLESVTINDFSYNLKTQVRDGLVEYLNQALWEYGRKIGFLSLDTDAVTAIPQDIIEIRYAVECEVQGYSEAITVDNTIQLLPQNLSMFRKMVPANQNAGEASPLDVWVRSKLDKIVKPLLLNKRYIEILTGFQPTALDIKIAMQGEATSIGFSAEHIVSVPNLKHFELSREFTLEAAEGIEYLTNDANVKVKLGTAVTSRIVDFQEIEAYLDPKTDIKTLMQDAIKDTVQEKLNQVIPERYYMRFYHAGVDDQGQPLENQSVEEELKEAIKKMLRDRFGAIVSSIVPRPIDTPIVKHYRELRGRIGKFQFEVLPLSVGEPVKFYAEFQILGVEQNSWYIFQERMESMQRTQETRRKELERLQDIYDRDVRRSFADDAQDLRQMQEQIRLIEEEMSGIDNIRRAIESSIQQRLQTLEESALSYTDFRNLDAMQQAINTWAKDGVKKQYGLEIVIENLRRDRTLEETLQAEDARKTLEDDRRRKDVQRQLKMNEVDEAAALLEAEKKQREIRLKSLTASSQAKSDELEQLRSKRAKLIKHFDAKHDQEELDHLDNEIKRLEDNLPISSIENMSERLKSMEPKQITPKSSFLDAMATTGLPGTVSSQQIETGSSSASSDDQIITPEVIDPNKINES
jgi:hypothetical protein